MQLLMIDNYDSFTYNIVQYFGELGADVQVVRNDEITLDGVAERIAAGVQRLVISPGPCSPAEAGISVAAIQRFAGQLPILGVCLGHQALVRRLAARSCARSAHARQDQCDHHHTRGRFCRAAHAVHRQPLPLAGYRAQLVAPKRWRSRPGPTTAKSWACVTRHWRSRACSSTPSPS
jgi:anthranilate synthase/aminodeoxychorismate synthase-like glutamine amidotransferase